MAGKLACAAVVLLGLAVRPVCGQYDDIDFEKMMAGYEDMYGGGYGGYGGMGDMMPGLAGMMGGMGGGMGYGGYGYGDSGPAHTDLTDMADVEKFMDADPTSPCVIGFYNEDTHGEDVMTFRTAASRMAQMGVRFGLATEDDVLEKLKYKGGRVMAYPAKRFLVEGDRPKQRYPGSGPLDPEPLQMWVAKAVTPLVGLFTWESGIRYEQIGLPELTAYAQVDIVEKAEEFDKLASTLRAVAMARPKKELSYVVADFDDMISLASRFKFPNEQKAPEERGVSVGIRKDNFFYRMDGEFSEAAVAAFVDEYVKGAVKPIHVEDIDEENPMAAAADQGDDEADSDVVVLNLDNFDAVVKEEGKDVMLEFYAPWCGHCKELKPVYAQVAAEVSDTPSIVVAKMDADANTPPEGFSIQSYPTLMFLKAGEKSNPIPYEGMRDVDSIVAFIRENASPPVAAAA